MAKWTVILVVLVCLACSSSASLAPTVAPTPEPSRQTFSGDSDQATPLFDLQPGIARLEFTHHGERNFIVHMLDSAGNRVDLVANAVGAGDYSKAVKIETAGQYLLNVQADGAWTVVITQ